MRSGLLVNKDNMTTIRQKSKKRVGLARILDIMVAVDTNNIDVSLTKTIQAFDELTHGYITVWKCFFSGIAAKGHEVNLLGDDGVDGVEPCLTKIDSSKLMTILTCSKMRI